MNEWNQMELESPTPESSPPDTTSQASSYTPPAAPDAPKPEHKRFVPPPIPPVRRVGTLTMGIALIAAGLTALAYTFIPGFNLILVLKLSPIIFILLGIEVLIAFFFHKGERIKYDFLSGFVCFCLIICCGVLSVIPVLWNYYGPEAIQAHVNLERNARQQLYQAFYGTSVPVSDCYVQLDSPYYISAAEELDQQQLAENSTLFLDMELANVYQDPLSFATDAKIFLDLISQTPYELGQVHIYSSNADEQIQFELNFHNGEQFFLGLTPELLVDHVEEIVYDTVDASEEEESESSLEQADSSSTISDLETSPQAA